MRKTKMLWIGIAGWAFTFCGQTLAVEPVLNLSAPDIQAVLRTDNSRPPPHPYRFAAPIPVRITPDTHGAWQTQGDDRLLWRLIISSTGARSLSLAFTRFDLPTGAQLNLSAPDGRDHHGPYGTEHATGGQLWTPPVRGETAVIELRLPTSARSNLGLELTQVNYGFRGFATDRSESKLRKCHLDVACPEGDEWRNETRAVARIVTAGTFGCTGQLLNNTAQDFRPYFISAGHCFPANGAEAATTVVMWNYENRSCGGNRDGDVSQTQTGASLRATPVYLPVTLQPDFILLELSQKPPADFRVYYSGWDRRDLAPVGAVGISHPAGEEKRISLDDDPTEMFSSVTISNSGVDEPTNLDVAGWSRGSTEPGSSGSGLWNLEHRLVGVLSTEASDASCGKEGNSYGRFYSAWNHLKTRTTSVASHLDPLNSGVEVLDGADPNGLDLRPAPVKTHTGGSLLIGVFAPGVLVVLLVLTGVRIIPTLGKDAVR